MIAAHALDWANIVRDRREAIGMTQAELAARIGMSRQWVSRFEHGEAASARLDTALLVLAVLEIDPDLEAPGA